MLINLQIYIKLIFCLYILFSLTTLRLTFDLFFLSRAVNIFIFLSPFLVLLLYKDIAKTHKKDVVFILLSCLLITSFLVNPIINGFSLGSLIKSINASLPWLYVILFAFVRFQKEFFYDCWKLLNNILFLLTVFGLFDYVNIFYLGNVPEVSQTDYGDFFLGSFTILHSVTETIPHFRFYGPFVEPGSFAMWALVLTFYNFYEKKYIMALVFLIASILTFSPSIFIGFGLLLFLSLFIKSSKEIFLIKSMCVLFFVSVIAVYFSEITALFDAVLLNKSTSFGERFDSMRYFFEELPSLAQKYPFGLEYFQNTDDKLSTGLNLIGNFTPIMAFENGGVMAFVAYILILSLFFFQAQAFFLKHLDNHLLYYAIYFFIFLSFIIQRNSIFETIIFPFLFGFLFYSAYDNKIFNNNTKF